MTVETRAESSVSRLGRVARSWRGEEGLDRLRSAGIVFPFLALFLTLSLASEPFATKDNLLNILDQQAAALIIAAAGTLVLVAGGIDLSVGATYAFAGVTAMHFAQTENAALAIFIGIAAGMVVGLCNGVVVTVLRVNSLITTLAASFVVGGIASLVAGGNLLFLPEGHPFGNLARPTFLTVKMSVWLMLAAILVLGIVLARTTAGRYMYAAGGSVEAARLAGVRVDAIRILTFALSGTAAGLAGVLDASRVFSAQASTGDVSLTFTVLAGIVVGGTSILGGDGAVWRTVLGILFIALIGNGYALLGYDPLYEQITTGAILVAAVATDAWVRHRRV